MNPEPKRTETYYGNERRAIERFPAATRESEFLKEQALKAAGKEIGDLYDMLQHKCIQRGLTPFRNSALTPLN